VTVNDCRAAEALRRACGALRVDDHSDLEICATAVAVGTDREGVADLGDSDVFRVDVDEWQTIHFHLEGAVHAGLYSRAGHRLGSGGGAGSHHLVETLGPGSYFLRVEGDGAYRLMVEDLEAR